MMKKAFYFILKLSSFSRYLNFFPDFLAMSKKQLDWKYKVNFKIYDITTCLINNYNTNIAQYFFLYHHNNVHRVTSCKCIKNKSK